MALIWKMQNRALRVLRFNREGEKSIILGTHLNNSLTDFVDIYIQIEICGYSVWPSLHLRLNIIEFLKYNIWIQTQEVSHV